MRPKGRDYYRATNYQKQMNLLTNRLLIGVELLQLVNSRVPRHAASYRMNLHNMTKICFEWLKKKTEHIVFYFQEMLFQQSSIIGSSSFLISNLRRFLEPFPYLRRCWDLCYRASSHGRSASTFHSRCDGKPHTVTIIRKSSYVFGGYTDIPWGMWNG